MPVVLLVVVAVGLLLLAEASTGWSRRVWLPIVAFAGWYGTEGLRRDAYHDSGGEVWHTAQSFAVILFVALVGAAVAAQVRFSRRLQASKSDVSR